MCNGEVHTYTEKSVRVTKNFVHVAGVEKFVHVTEKFARMTEKILHV